MAPRCTSLLALLALAALCAPAATAQGCGSFRVLVFHRTAGYKHGEQIAAGLALLHALGSAHGFTVDTTEDPARLGPDALGQYAVVVFLNTSGDVLAPAQEAAFASYIGRGGGFVGVHAAADTEYGWPFYGSLLGAWFLSHPPVQPALVQVADPTHPATAALPASFVHTDEWYDFQTNVAGDPNIRVLLTVDEASYSGGRMGPVHPIAWCQEYAGGRSFYTALGHTLSTYAAPFFADHLLGGIRWAAAAPRHATICTARPYGTATGATALRLDGALPAPGLAAVQLSGADPLGAGTLLFGRCPDAVAAGPLVLLVDPAPDRFLGAVPIAFDAAGQWRSALPATLLLPRAFGTALHLQGIQLAPGLAASNGLRLGLCE